MVVMGIKEKLGFGSSDDLSEEDLKKLDKRRRELERKAKIKQLKRRVSELEGDGGILGKLGGIASDMTKEGETRALNHLVGPPEDFKVTSSFVIGPNAVKRNKGSVPDFLLGDNNPEREKDIGIEFPISDGNDEDLEDITKEMMGVKP